MVLGGLLVYKGFSMAESDPYKMLGVLRNATSETIEKAYRSKIHKYHPDINKEPGSKEKFQEIQTAFETLSDPVKRAAYDNTTEQIQRRPAKGIYNPRMLYKSSSGLSDKSALIMANIICVLLMILLSGAVFLIVLGVKGAAPTAPGYENSAEHKKWEEDRRDAYQTVLFVDIIFFVVVIGSLNLGYVITHQD
jgi:curved DNA-binding protein CbpA